MRILFSMFVVVVFVLSWTGASTIAAETTKPTADQYQECGVLVHNGHSLFESPQDKMGAVVNSMKLFEKWQQMLGLSNQEAIETLKPLLDNSFQEFDSKEKFHETYSQQEQEFCADLLKAEIDTK